VLHDKLTTTDYFVKFQLSIIFRQCKDDRRMPNQLTGKCVEIMAKSTEICPCIEKVDCNVLSQLNNLQKTPVMKSQITSEDGKPRPGKIKQAKHKMWDEL